MTKELLLNRIEKGHTNGLYVSSEILREINKLK